jgi:CDP-3, 6-dideoxy-D-glycero-L-glycero-4-hexulose-4-reductase
MKNILLIGINGFLGKNITEELINSFNIFALVNYNKKKLIKKSSNKKIHYIFYKNFKDIEKKIIKKKIYCLINFATFYKKDHKSSDINKLINSNIRLPILLYELSKKLKIKKFITFGSVWEHFNGIQNNPHNLYAATKLSSYFIMNYYSKYNLSTNYYYLLLSDTYGPNDRRKKLIPTLLNNYKKNKVTIINSRKLNINYLHVKDVSLALKIIMKKNIKPGRYLLKNTNKFSAQNLINLVNQKLMKKIKVEWLNNVKNTKSIKIKKLPYWKPIYKIEKNLLKLLNEKN